MTELPEQLTQVAAAAWFLVEKLTGRTSSGMENAVKVLKAPDAFTGDDSFMNWKASFMSWLGYGDDRYLNLIPAVEKMTQAPDISVYKPEDKELAHKFYAILSSYLRGKRSSSVRAESENRDGFKLWYGWIREFQPSMKQRNLSLAQTLASHPSFRPRNLCLRTCSI